MNEQAQAPQAPPAPPVTGGSNATYKRPLLAAFLSAMPGLGNIYNGLYLRGVVFFLVIVSLIALVNRGGYEILGFAIAFVWLFNAIDAYRQATLINYGYAHDLGITDLPAQPKAGQGGFLAGGLLFVIGLFAMMEMYLPAIDIDWILDLWPFGLMALGAWVIWRTVQEKQDRENSATADEI